MTINHKEPYGPLRAKAYPKVTDQLDAVFKLAVALRAQGIILPPETADWIDQCQHVKDTYPKAAD